jgi:thymidylate kinase
MNSIVGKKTDETPSADWDIPFVHGLFAALDEAGVRWMVLRNHDRLDRIGHDLDLVVHPADVARFESSLRGVLRDRGLFLLRVRRGIEHLSFDVADSDLRGRLLLHLDVQQQVAYRGRTLIDADDLFAHRRRTERGVQTLIPGMEAYALLLHSALHKGTLKEAYAARVAAIEAAAPDELLRVASDRLGPELGRRLAAVRDEAQLLALREDLARAIDRRYPANRWRRPWFVVHSGVGMSAQRIKPRGIFVVFLGPDGSGKSTTTDLLKDVLTDPSGIIPVHRVYLGSGRPILPTRKVARKIHKRLRRDRQGQLRDVRPRRVRGALHVMADQVVRYWVQVRPRLSPHGIVLADRYAYDVLRINNSVIRSRWFKRLSTAVIPLPDITFFLEGDPNVVAERKKELTVAETIRQQEAYRDIAELIPTFRPLDLTVRDDRALRRVALEILDVFAARNDGTPTGDGSAAAHDDTTRTHRRAPSPTPRP